MAKTLYTFGYEGLSIDSFIARLKAAGVETVYDVRELPLSRKKGFSKTAFGIALRDVGFEYIHLPVFGCPRPIRDQYRADGNWDRYEKAFSSYLSKRSDEVKNLARATRATIACLVCFEADFNFCHRSIVANAVVSAGGPRVVHLTAKAEPADRTVRLAA
jgi:uncharacterized protein (DUF488 family)